MRSYVYSWGKFGFRRGFMFFAESREQAEQIAVENLKFRYGRYDLDDPRIDAILVELEEVVSVIFQQDKFRVIRSLEEVARYKVKESVRNRAYESLLIMPCNFFIKPYDFDEKIIGQWTSHGHDHCQQCGYVDVAVNFWKKDKCPNPNCPHPEFWSD